MSVGLHSASARAASRGRRFLASEIEHSAGSAQRALRGQLEEFERICIIRASMAQHYIVFLDNERVLVG